MTLEKVLALDATGVIEKTIDTGSGGGGPVTEFTGDVNTLVTGGPYHCTAACTNQPIAGTAFILEVLYRASGDVIQRANPTSNTLSGTYIREYNPTTWSTWAAYQSTPVIMTPTNIVDLMLDSSTYLNNFQPWVQYPGIGMGNLLLVPVTASGTLAYINSGAGRDTASAIAGTGAAVTFNINNMAFTTGTTATGYANANRRCTSVVAPFSKIFFYSNPTSMVYGNGSIWGCRCTVNLPQASDAVETYTAMVTLLGAGPATNTAVGIANDGFSVSYTNAVNSGRWIIQYRGQAGTVKTVNTSVTPVFGASSVDANNNWMKAVATLISGVVTITITINGVAHVITDAPTTVVFRSMALAARLVKTLGATARTMTVAAAAMACNFL